MPRRKITTLVQPYDLTNLPSLTTQEFAAVKAYLDSDKITRVAAYCEGYPVAVAWTDNARWCEASKFFSDPKVVQWTNAFRADQINDATCTRAQHIKELARLKRLAETTGNVGAAVQAEQLRGKVEGLYIEKVQSVTDVPDDVTLLNAIDSLLDSDYPGIRAVAEKRLAGDFSDIPAVTNIVVQDYVKLPSP